MILILSQEGADIFPGQKKKGVFATANPLIYQKFWPK
jgi:hypothetical protein